ncbi:Alpha/Beta hydrolase protein [Scenedesmus sp. NREL 46B-D3]|nr:Alpha/Beta hydrolase protein [Scenedesmus sp. NREL 46B-D3]
MVLSATNSKLTRRLENRLCMLASLSPTKRTVIVDVQRNAYGNSAFKAIVPSIPRIARMLGSARAATLMFRNSSSSSGGDGTSSKTAGRSNASRRHRRSKSWASMDSLADLNIHPTPGQALERLLLESWMVAGLALKLWSYLGLGWKWLVQVYRLILYAMLLLPGFLQMIHYYYTSPSVKRSVIYGRKPRQRLDLYVPKSAQEEELLPVVIFVTGGAWTIGYKAWGALLGRRLCEAGVVVACLDYRNFPQGSALDMLEDVNTGIAWLLRKSAGGQLAMLALLSQATQAATGQAVLGGAPLWHPSCLSGFVGVSGAYDLEGLAAHLHRRGLYKDLLDTIMSINGQVAYELLSPLHAARDPPPNLAAFMPSVLLMHGTTDKSVPVASSLLLSDALTAAGVDCSVQLLPGKTHTDLLLEDALGGGRDVLSDSILACITGREEVSDHPSMCPKLLVRLAGCVCPF